MKNNTIQYIILYYNILVKSHWNNYLNDFDAPTISILDRYYEGHASLDSAFNRTKEFYSYEEAVAYEKSGWCVFAVFDTHGKEVFIGKEVKDKMLYFNNAMYRRYYRHYFKRIHYHGWNEECSNAKLVKRFVRENYGVNIKVRNHPLDNWENPRSNTGRGWKSQKIKRQYLKNRREGNLCQKS